jgi:3-oxoacyl-[acyl-carrier protein] reductase
MQLNLAGKTALVTGSSHGVGRVIAECLRDEGCNVALNGRDPDRLKAAAHDLNCAVAVVGDVSQPDGAAKVVQEVVTALGKLDILVCNVGSGRSVPAGMETFDEWQRVFSLNLWSATNTIEAARPALEESRGSIVCISSICGLEVIPGAPLTYSVAKAALHAYVRGLARPLGAQHIRINAIALGNIIFKNSVWEKKIDTNTAEVEEMLAREVALVRLGRPEEAANLVAYLASEQAAFATGGVWRLDGGQARA